MRNTSFVVRLILLIALVLSFAGCSSLQNANSSAQARWTATRLQLALQTNSADHLVNLFAPAEREEFRQRITAKQQLQQMAGTEGLDVSFLNDFRAQEGQTTFVITGFRGYIRQTVKVQWVVISLYGTTTQTETFDIIIPVVYENGSWYISRTSHYETDRAIKDIDFAEKDINRIRHIMQTKHQWNQVTSLTGDISVDYQVIKTIVGQVVANAQAKTEASPAGIKYTYEGPFGDDVIHVELIEMNGKKRIVDAWPITK